MLDALIVHATDPRPGNRAMAQDPVVELLERPAFSSDEAAVEFLNLDPTQEIAHRDGG